MSFRLRRALAWIFVAGVAASSLAQTSAKPAARAPVTKPYCHPRYEFCFQYPAAWMMLGEVFDGHGVTIAPAQKQDREQWDEVTVALVIPAPDEDEDPVSLGEAIAQAVSGVRKSGQSFETLQRQQRTVNGNPAELVKLHYLDKASNQEWVEELVFIQGPDAEIYSVALKSSPATLAKMEPPFAKILDTWKLPRPAPPPVAAEGIATPKPKTAPTKPTTTPKP
jgi:hypothetical protein